MIDRIRSELLPFADAFQSAGDDGLRRVRTSPYDGDQWKTRRLQRDPYLHGLYLNLPEKLGTFQRENRLYPQNRLVYRSLPLESELIFRRRGSLRGAPEAEKELSLFAAPPRAFPPNPEIRFRQVACIWDLPILNSEHEAESPFPFIIKVAKENTVLGQGQWEGGFALLAEAGLMPSAAQFDMNDLDWEVDASEEAEGQ